MTVVGKVESLWRYPVKSMAEKKSPNRIWGFLACMGIGFTPFTTNRPRRDFRS